MRPVRLVIVTCLLAAVSAGAGPIDENWRSATSASYPVAVDPGPHPAATHEWWFFTVLAEATETCDAWQAMVTFLSDRELGEDRLLFTSVEGATARDHTLAFGPGSLTRTTVEGHTILFLGDSAARGDAAAWDLRVRAEASLDLTLERVPATSWYRRAPEGAGRLEMTLAARARVPAAALTVGDRRCEATDAVGYFEHVWGDWTRLPMWGVDHLEAHAADGWSVYARATPMRGEGNLYPFLGVEPDAYWPPAMVITDGTVHYEARTVEFHRIDGTEMHPELGVLLPDGYVVTGSSFTALQGGSPPGLVTLTVGRPMLASILFPTTSSGVLEGPAPATIDVDGTLHDGVAEVEFQRYGTRYPR